MIKILVTDKFHEKAFLSLRSNEGFVVLRSERPEPTTQELSKAQALITRTKTTVDQALLGNAPELKLIVSTTAGFDHIDFSATQKKNITVCHTPVPNAHSAAEHTVNLILNLLRKLSASEKALRSGQWKESLAPGVSLRGKSLGLIGLGRVGQKVAQMARAFDMKVSAYDPYVEKTAFEIHSVERKGLTEILRESQVISLHVPLTKETHHLISDGTLELFSTDAVLINTSRGPVVSENALIKALETQELQGAALDVFESEPLSKTSALRHFPNVILTPHVGALTEEAFYEASMQACQKVMDYFNGKEVSDRLPPVTEWSKHL